MRIKIRGNFLFSIREILQEAKTKKKREIKLHMYVLIFFVCSGNLEDHAKLSDLLLINN